MADIKRPTTVDLYTNLKFSGVAGSSLITETDGFATKGDGGAQRWQLNGVTGQTPSQSPSDLGNNSLLNDASGNQWALIPNELPTVADLVASSLPAGKVIDTVDYYSTQRGGGGRYLIKTAARAATDGDTIDEFGNHTIGTGDVAILQNNGSIDILQYGAKEGGVTDVSAEMAAALATGRDVEVPVGDWFIGVATNVVVTAQKLFGSGTIIKSNAINYGVYMAGLNPEVSGLTFNGQSQAAQPSTEIKILEGAVSPRVINNNFVGATYSAVMCADEPAVATDYPYTVNVEDVVIRDNRFDGYTRPLMQFCMERYTITGNYFTGSSADAIRIRETIGDGIISNNKFFDVGIGTDATTRDAIDTAFSGFKLVIADNIINTTANIGIDIKGTDSGGEVDGFQSDMIVVSGNVISNTFRSGIAIGGIKSSMIVTDNIVYECNQSNSGGAGSDGDSAIRIKDQSRYLVVKNNIVKANFGHGISLEAPTVGVDYFIVDGNICINNNRTGIFCEHATNGKIINNICRDDALENNSGAQLIGLELFSPTVSGERYLLDVSRNIFTDNASIQIQIQGSLAMDAFFQFKDNFESGTGSYGASGTNFDRIRSEPQRQLQGNGVPPVAAMGNFKVGDIIWDTTASAGGFIGIVCVTAGSPGTWKSFGPINA